MQSAVVIARPVSKEPVEVMSVYAAKVWRLSPSDAAGSKASEPWWSGTSTAPRLNGQPCRFISSPYR